jgi:pimeloyl-ACP methyl ester carboxylesterase
MIRARHERCSPNPGHGEVEYAIAGEGAPTLVLINGSGGPIDAWFRVWEGLTPLGTVLAYNRAGIGGTAPAAEPQTAAAMVEELRLLLQALALPMPLVLIGHSFGGLIANLHARLHPDEIRAVVMLEATAPEDVETLPQLENWLQRLLRRATVRSTASDALSELAQAGASVRQIAAAPPFPDLPLRVVTGARPAMRWVTPTAALHARATHQQQLALLSAHGQQVIAQRSGHFPQLTEPALVVETIRSVLAHGARSGVE